MPSSLLALAPRVVTYVAEAVEAVVAAEHRAARVLDVGPGHGKYGVLLREYLNVDHVERLDAIEAELRYVERFPWLEHLYDDLVVADVAWTPHLTLASYDVILMADVLEHLERDVALELLDACPGYVVISTPRDFFQNPEADAGWPTERHRSHWTAADFGGRVDREDVDALSAYAAVLVRLARQ